MRQFTVGELRTKARERADMVNSGFITDDELNGYISASYTDLYDILVKSGLSFFESEQTVITDGVNNRYTLPTDYYGTIGVDYRVNNDVFLEIPEYMVTERNAFNQRSSSQALGYRILNNQISLDPLPPAIQTYRHLYVPTPARLGIGLIVAFGTYTKSAALPVAGNTFTISDGVNTFIFEYQANKEDTTAGSYFVAVGVTVEISNTNLRDAVNASGIRINAVAATLDTVIQFSNQDGGVHGNVALATTVGSTTLTGMAGGAGVGIMDGVAGWEEYVVVDAAIKMLEKEESSAVPLERERQRLLQRIQEGAENRAMTSPRRVVDIDSQMQFDLFGTPRDRFGIG